MPLESQTTAGDQPATALPAPALSDDASDITPAERDRMIQSFAERVVKRGLATPAVFMLEMHKPLCFFGSQLLLLGAPLLGAFFGFGRLSKIAALIEKRQNVDLLVRAIEQASEASSASAGEAGR